MSLPTELDAPFVLVCRMPEDAAKIMSQWAILGGPPRTFRGVLCTKLDRGERPFALRVDGIATWFQLREELGLN